jgi:hypothetical protein
MKGPLGKVYENKVPFIDSMSVSWSLSSSPTKKLSTNQTGVNVWARLQRDGTRRFEIKV